MSALLEVHDLARYFGGLRAVDGASFAIEQGVIAGLIGPNGAGKTTCFNCLSGFLRPSGGRVRFNGEDITGMSPHRIFRRGLVRTFQIPQELETMTVLENLMLAESEQRGEQLWRNWLLPRQVAREERALEDHAPRGARTRRPRAHGLRPGRHPLRRTAQAARTRPARS